MTDENEDLKDFENRLKGLLWLPEEATRANICQTLAVTLYNLRSKAARLDKILQACEGCVAGECEACEEANIASSCRDLRHIRAQALCWHFYEQWKETGDTTYCDMLCRAEAKLAEIESALYGNKKL